MAQRGVGVALYLRDCFPSSFGCRTCTDSWEILGIKVNSPDFGQLDIVVCYRHSATFNDWNFEQLQAVFGPALDGNHRLLITGDFNVDILDSPRSSVRTRLLGFL